MKFFSTKEVAELLGYSSANVVRIYCERYGIGEKIGSRWRLTASDVSEIAAKQIRGPGRKKTD